MSEIAEIRLPQFGMGMVDGTIVEWFKSEGDSVIVDEVVAEVETAKSTEQLVAPASGAIGRILVPAGATVDVHTLLAVIVPVGADTSALRLNELTPSADAVPAPPAPMPVAQQAPTRLQPLRQVTPRARRLALDLGIDVDSLTGTGPDGRVTEDDVRAVNQNPTA